MIEEHRGVRDAPHTEFIEICLSYDQRPSGLELRHDCRSIWAQESI